MVLDVKEGRELALAAKPVSQNGRAEWEQGTAGESTKGGCEGGKLVGNLAGSRAAGGRRVSGGAQVNRRALRGWERRRFCLQGQADPVSTLLCSPAGTPARNSSCTLSPAVRIASPGLCPPRFLGALCRAGPAAPRKGRACQELRHPLPRGSHVFRGERQQPGRRETWHRTAFRRRRRAPAGGVGGRLNYANRHLGRAVG